VVAVNPSSVQGPGRDTGTGKILRAAARGRLRYAFDTTFSLVDITDCARGHILAGEAGRPGERYLLSGATLSTREAISVLEKVTGPLPPPRYLPEWLLPLAGAAGSVLPLSIPVCPESVRVARHGHRLDGSKATRELGLRYTPVEETFRRTVEWFRETGRL
jgi:dihydroflavonol-4-reductase